MIFFHETIPDKFTEHFYECTGSKLNSSASSLRSIDSIRLVSIYSLKVLFCYIFRLLGRFQQFDYENKRMNRRRYGQDTPPSYNLTQITVPTHLYYSKHDDLMLLESVMKTASHIEKCVKTKYLVPVDGFNHVDFTYSRFVREGVYDKIISTMNATNGL